MQLDRNIERLFNYHHMMLCLPLFTSIFVCLFAFPVDAHSHSPMAIKEISLTGNQSIQIKIGNQDNHASYFDIELDGVVIEEGVKVAAKSYRNHTVLIRNIEPNIESKRRLCSISKPANGGYLRTRICTRLRLIYPKDKLKYMLENEL